MCAIGLEVTGVFLYAVLVVCFFGCGVFWHCAYCGVYGVGSLGVYVQVWILGGQGAFLGLGVSVGGSGFNSDWGGGGGSVCVRG